MKIKFKSFDDLEEFINDMTNLNCDVNILDGHQVFDAKSLMTVVNLDIRKTFIVECVSDDEDQLKIFRERIEKYVADN